MAAGIVPLATGAAVRWYRWPLILLVSLVRLLACTILLAAGTSDSGDGGCHWGAHHSPRDEPITEHVSLHMYLNLWTGGPRQRRGHPQAMYMTCAGQGYCSSHTTITAKVNG